MKNALYMSFFFLCTIFINCTTAQENKDDKRASRDSEDINNSTVASAELKQQLEERFSDTYKEQFVKFNDGSNIDITKPLNFKKPINNSVIFFVGKNVESIEDFELDVNGVVKQDGNYHPTTIGKIALKAINHYKETKSEKSKKIFLNHLKWIEDNFYETDNYGFWYFSVPAPTYHLKSGWTSAFSQGLLLNVCLEAYKLTNDRRHAIMIEKALKAYMVPVENGGFLRMWDGNELWFEEYGTARPSRVLNGTIYGLEGVYNVYQDLDSKLALKIFESGVNSIRNHLEDFNAYYTSRYSLADWKNELTQEHYHEEHVIQLLWLFSITNDPVFKKYAKLFLESDKHHFLTTSIYKIYKPKIKNITAENCIDCVKYGPENLIDELWAYGKFWSTHKKTELIVDFGEIRQNISGITLYHVTDKSVNVNFDLFAYNEFNGEWDHVQEFVTRHIKDRVSGYNKTGKYETYIQHYKIFEQKNTQKMKLVFHANNNNIVALREINFLYDRTEDLDHLIKVVEQRRNKM